MMIAIYVLTGFLVGMGLSAQTSINGRLRKSVGSPFLTSFLSFTVSTLFFVVIALALTDLSVFSTELLRVQPLYLWLGGVFGLIFLTGNIVLFPKLGAVQTVIFPVLGQILSGIIIDEFGLLGASVSPMNLYKAAGIICVIIGVLGVVICSHPKRDDIGEKVVKRLWFWRILGIFTGACSAFQITVNGKLGIVLHTPILAALVSFIVGTCSLLVIVCIQRPGFHIDMPVEGKNPWWMWMGGFLGALYVLGNAWIGPYIGTGATVVACLAGLMTAGLIIDQTGLFESSRKPIHAKQILFLLWILVGVCLIRLI